MKNKFINYRIADPPFSKSIEVNLNECKTVRDIKKKISFDLHVLDLNVVITNAPHDDKLEKYAFKTFNIKIENCCKDIDFNLPNNSIISIKDCYKMTFPQVIEFFQEKHIYYSDDCIKNIQFIVKGQEVPHIQYPFLAIQKSFMVNVRMKCEVAIIDYGYNRFIFSTNETVSDAEKLIKGLYEGCSCVSISTNVGREIKLKSFDKFRSYSKYKLSVDFEIKFKHIKSTALSTHHLDFLSTVYDAKKSLAIVYSNEGELKPENIILYNSYKIEINDTRKTLKSIQRLDKDQFYFDIDKKKKFHQIPTEKTDMYMIDPALIDFKQKRNHSYYNYEHQHSKSPERNPKTFGINNNYIPKSTEINNYNKNFLPNEQHDISKYKQHENWRNEKHKHADPMKKYSHDSSKPKSEPYANQHINNISNAVKYPYKNQIDSLDKPINHPYKNQNDNLDKPINYSNKNDDFSKPKKKSHDVQDDFNFKDSQKQNTDYGSKNKTPSMLVSDDEELSESDDKPKIIIPLNTQLSSSYSSQKSINNSKKTDFSDDENISNSSKQVTNISNYNSNSSYKKSKDDDNKIKTSIYSSKTTINDDDKFDYSNSMKNSSSKNNDNKIKTTNYSNNANISDDDKLDYSNSMKNSSNKNNDNKIKTSNYPSKTTINDDDKFDYSNSFTNSQSKDDDNKFKQTINSENENKQIESSDNDDENSKLKQTKVNGNDVDFEEEEEESNENELHESKNSHKSGMFSADISSLLIEEEEEEEYEQKKRDDLRSKANKYYFQTNKNSKVDEIYLDSNATVKAMKQVIANKEGINNLNNIKILFAGKELLDDLVLEELNIGDTNLFIYIRSEEDILLMTAKALQIDTNLILEEEEEEID